MTSTHPMTATAQSDVRRGALAVVVGAVLYLAGDLMDVLGLVENLYTLEGAAERVAALEAEPTAWDVEHLLTGLGYVIAAVGLWLLGRSLAAAASDARSQRMATIAGWAGLATAVWAVNSFFAIVRPAQDVAAALEDPTAEMIVTGLVFVVGVIVAFVTLGITLLRLRHQRWLGWTLAVLGPLGALSVIGAGPSLPMTLMLLLGVALSVRPYPSSSDPTETVPDSP